MREGSTLSVRVWEGEVLTKLHDLSSCKRGREGLGSMEGPKEHRGKGNKRGRNLLGVL